ncbi:hypothetical protein F4805DRAFT_431276 [Annulohypoxylon moriforme]|nr:hypothetical protein F4805DRAFT_431276 [Annulohypoxylon moriforme]
MRGTGTTTVSNATSGDKINSPEYCSTLDLNLIYFQDDLYRPQPLTPDWVQELFKEIENPPQYPRGRGFLDVLCESYLRSKGALRYKGEANLEAALGGFFPLQFATCIICYEQTTSPRPPWESYFDMSIRRGIPRDIALATHLRGFSIGGLKASRPNAMFGYNHNWLMDILNDDTQEAMNMYERYQITSDGTLFPYLFTEYKTGENGGIISATNQLLTCCAAALSSTKRIIKGNHGVFALSIIGEDVQLSVMWMDGTMEKTSFILGATRRLSLATKKGAHTLQDWLMNIHHWGLNKRIKDIEKEVIAEQQCIKNNSVRPRANFELEDGVFYDPPGSLAFPPRQRTSEDGPNDLDRVQVNPSGT